jgi:hypothetical protein
MNLRTLAQKLRLLLCDAQTILLTRIVDLIIMKLRTVGLIIMKLRIVGLIIIKLRTVDLIIGNYCC